MTPEESRLSACPVSRLGNLSARPPVSHSHRSLSVVGLFGGSDSQSDPKEIISSLFNLNGDAKIGGFNADYGKIHLTLTLIHLISLSL